MVLLSDPDGGRDRKALTPQACLFDSPPGHHDGLPMGAKKRLTATFAHSPEPGTRRLAFVTAARSPRCNTDSARTYPSPGAAERSPVPRRYGADFDGSATASSVVTLGCLQRRWSDPQSGRDARHSSERSNSNSECRQQSGCSAHALRAGKG
ncbi:hypothetical protein VFPFJ_05992 [Purpureocillium lilacinum]|uniref:Uncharacterized protein n=1 Tax=Purpureocillium lilacinum TaxID=33203 RepID=A0A179HIW2_PURLI|nr:hypothetical protein VFPFJ_05992 [Purpureocillium lilacinum]OAQ89578.1 hypothetical protein VFPFJ_05992 [Purpureocillium lilacinum]